MWSYFSSRNRLDVVREECGRIFSFNAMLFSRYRVI
jgi:hypothetical protein